MVSSSCKESGQRLVKEDKAQPSNTYLGLAEPIMLPAKDAATKLVDLCPTLPAVQNWVADDTTGCGIGIGVRVGVVGCLVHVLRGEAPSV